MREERVLVFGAGSIGRRHVTNLAAIGQRTIAAVDPDPDCRAAISGSVAACYATIEEAIAAFSPTIVLVCSPPSLHVAQARAAVAAGAHCFIEKPLSDRLDGTAELIAEAKARRLIVQVGYNFRFEPGLRQVRAWVEAGALGRLFWGRAEFGQYLPDWRPWQDYRGSYTSRSELGGGIILDASHELDSLTWLMGWPAQVFCAAGSVGSLDVDVEDSASIVLRFADGQHADVHVDFLQRGYSRSLKLAGVLGTAVWDFATRQVAIYRAGDKAWETNEQVDDVNTMYVAELRHFLDCVASDRAPAVGLDRGLGVLKLALAAKESARAGRWVEVPQA